MPCPLTLESSSKTQITSDQASSQIFPLPQELFTCIFRHLDSSTDRRAYEALRAASLACSIFAGLCQSILFEDISLGRTKNRNSPIRTKMPARSPSSSFLATITESPHLCHHVRSLEISDDNHMSFYREHLSWIREDKAVAIILPLLQNLRRLRIHGNPLGSRLDWKVWKPELGNAIVEKCRSGSLVKLVLSNVRNVSLSPFQFSPTFESFNFSAVHFADDRPTLGGDIEGLKKAPLPRLHRLHVFTKFESDRQGLFAWMRSLDLQSIVSLRLKLQVCSNPGWEGALSNDDCRSLSTILHKSSSSVEELDLDLPCIDSSFERGYHFLDLSPMVQLKTLYFTTCLWDDSAPPLLKNNLPVVNSILDRIPPLTRITAITIECFVFGLGMTHSLRYSKAGWSEFVQVIVRLSRAIDVQVVMHIRDEAKVFHRVQSDFEDLVAPLRDRNIIRFN